ncbi:hypothetical protein C8T65DRAFT_21263 [Cerioporus squamosus]|nr:hypothetical protein C8T65DRAFT_21263 [Cerioporus squamosus]
MNLRTLCGLSSVSGGVGPFFWIMVVDSLESEETQNVLKPPPQLKPEVNGPDATSSPTHPARSDCSLMRPSGHVLSSSCLTSSLLPLSAGVLMVACSHLPSGGPRKPAQLVARESPVGSTQNLSPLGSPQFDKSYTQYPHAAYHRPRRRHNPELDAVNATPLGPCVKSTRIPYHTGEMVSPSVSSSARPSAAVAGPGRRCA